MKDLIVQAALTWNGTPYHHQARVKGIGVDCAQFIAAVAEEVGIIQPGTKIPFDYSPEWHLHNTEEKLIGYLKHFGCVEQEGPGEPGDIIAFRIGHCIGHLGILLPNSQFIHAQNRSDPKQVTVNTLSAAWQKRHAMTFSFPGVYPNVK